MISPTITRAKIPITAQIEQKLELLKTYKNAYGPPGNSNTRRCMHIVRPLFTLFCLCWILPQWIATFKIQQPATLRHDETQNSTLMKATFFYFFDIGCKLLDDKLQTIDFVEFGEIRTYRIWVTYLPDLLINMLAYTQGAHPSVYCQFGCGQIVTNSFVCNKFLSSTLRLPLPPDTLRPCSSSICKRYDNDTPNDGDKSRPLMLVI